jgi:2Fe-2S ferredoxin
MGGHAVPKVVFTSSDGTQRVVDGAAGESVMRAAVSNGVDGIIAECGGNASCATCHVWVADEFLPALQPPAELEEDLLEMGVTERREGSRLSCQISLTDELDGLAVEIPPDQP